MARKAKDHYVDSKELEDLWIKWDNSQDIESWKKMLEMVYKICFGAALKFSPKEELEREEMAHDAFATTMMKIKDKKLKYIPGKGRAFNLITTAIIRHIQSRKNREKAGKRVYEKFLQKQIQSSEDWKLLSLTFNNSPAAPDHNDDAQD